MRNTHSFPEQLKAFYRKNRKHRAMITGILILIVVLLACLMITIGNTRYSLSEAFSILRSGSTKGAGFTINRLRLPKLLIGALAGFAFGVSGHTFQTLLRNSLASPDIIGITAGSSSSAVFCILILRMSGRIVSLFSIIGGLSVTALIFILSGKNSTQANSRMILIGIGVQAILNALISWMLLIGSEYDVGTALRWLRGSLNSAQMENVLLTAVVVVVAVAGLTMIQRPLEMMQIGEEYPVTLGVNKSRIRISAMVLALLLSAAATAVTGPIASVAFLSGPIAARLTGRSGNAMYASGLVGIILVLASELIGQNAFAARYPVGVITGILGAPYLLMLLTQMNKKGVRG